MTYCNEHLQIEMWGGGGGGHTVTHNSFHDKIFKILSYLILWGRLQGHGDMSGIGVHGVEIHKESIKRFFLKKV
jgi:hypothetical protein